MPLPTRPLRDILPLVVPQAPGVSEWAAEQALRIAASEFCTVTRIWREILTVTVDEEDEAIVAPSSVALHEIESAHWQDGTPLTPVRFAATSPEDRSDQGTTAQAPQWITQKAHNTITVIPFATGDVTLSAILKPAEGPEFGVLVGGGTAQDAQNVIPEFMHQQYANTIADGALGRLLLQPQTEWHDPTRAAFHQLKFQQASERLSNRQIKGQHRATRGSTPQWF